MPETLKYLQLTWLVLWHGRLRHSGEDFNRNREQSLEELQDFIPNQPFANRKSTTLKNPFVRNIVAQLAFFKNSLITKGGHLSFNNLSYIRIPKAASTSVCKELLEKIYPALALKPITETQINFLTDLNLQTETANASNLFMIVRNPFARLVSVYRDLFENKDHYIYRDYLFGILPPQLSFSEFVERIGRIPDRLKDQHIKPQHSFLKYYEQKGLEVRVFKLEEPEPLNQFLNQHDLKLPHLNKSAESYDYRSYYNTQTLERVCEIYKTDVERFDYKMAEESLIGYVKTVQK